MVEIVTNQIVPAALEYMNKLITNVKGLKEIGVAATATKAQKDLASEIATNVNNLIAASAKLATASDKAHHAKTTEAAAKAYNDSVKPLLEEVRSYADALEKVVDDNVWPMPKYRELLFIR
jgi:glutamine synthetase